MALVLQKTFFERFYPVVQPKRFRGKINIQRPKPVHFERAVVQQLTQPRFINPNKSKHISELCSKQQERKKEEVDNVLQRFIAAELKCWFDRSKLIAFYHLNPVNFDQNFKAYVQFKKANMFYKQYGKKTLEMAIKGTKYETVLDFYVSQNMTVFSPDGDIRKLLKISKKCKHLVLLAAIFEGRFVSKDKLLELDGISNLLSAQAGLVQTLNSAAVTVTQQLNSHQGRLVGLLQERAKQLENQ